LARLASLPVVSLKGRPSPLYRQEHVENKLPLSWRRKAKFAIISSALFGNDKLGKDDEEKRMEFELDSEGNVDKPKRGRPPKRGRGRPPKNSDLPNAEGLSDTRDTRLNLGAINIYPDQDYDADEQAVQPSEFQYISRRTAPLRTIISTKDWQSLYDQFVKQFGSANVMTDVSTNALEKFYFKMLDILERHTTPKEEIDLLRDETRDIREELHHSLHDGLQHIESCRVKLQLELQQLRLKLHSDQVTIRQHNTTKLDALLQHLEQQMTLDSAEIALQIKKIREDSEQYLTINHVPTPPPIPNVAISSPAPLMNNVPSTSSAQREQQLRIQRELASKQHQQAADLYNQAMQLVTPPYNAGYTSAGMQVTGPHLPGTNSSQGYEGYMSQHNIEIPRSFGTSQRSPVTSPNLTFPNANAPLQTPHIVDRVPSPVKSRDALSSTSNPDRRDSPAESRNQLSQAEEKSADHDTAVTDTSDVTPVNAESAVTGSAVNDGTAEPATEQGSLTGVNSEPVDQNATILEPINSSEDPVTSAPMTGVTSEETTTPVVTSVSESTATITEVPEAVTQSYDMLVQSLQQLTGNASLTAEQLSELIAQQSGVVWDEEQVQEEGSIQPSNEQPQ